jgi:dipeptidyl aminopeptidase/acylaminoacyl peptidase
MSAPSGAPTIASYGSWASPLSAEALAAAGINFGDLRSANGHLYWVENVPARGGEVALWSSGEGVTAQVTPNGANVRTRVHEYGGAPFIVVGDTIYYSQLSDQRLYELKHGGAPAPVTPPNYRYADCIALPGAAKSTAAMVCVREDHTDPVHVRNALVRLALPVAGPGEVLFDGSDFVSYPRLSPDGRRLAFITWNHPNMPWDGTELRVAELTVAGLKASVLVAGGATESVLEPQWAGDGTLYYVSDRSGFWNLYADRGRGAQPIWPRAAEFAAPLWQFGQSNYVLLGTKRADPMRTAISGGSAGGYTVLVALSTSDVFRAGTDRFGVSDMTALARDTHKFESRYVDSLIGPLPQAQAVYDSRSPLNHLDGFKVPVLVLQGADDPVVPPNQSQRIVDALRARHVPVAYILYPGESHGFRKPETIINSQQAELAFYGRIFGFKPADQLPPLAIEGLPPAS